MNNLSVDKLQGNRALRCAATKILFILTIFVFLPFGISAGLIDESNAQQAPAPSNGIPSPSIATSLPSNGDWDGARAALAQRGIAYGIDYIGEVLGNASGGRRQGTIYEGRLEGVLEADLEKLMGLHGLTFHGNAYQIHGSGLSREDLGNLLAVSSIEALTSTRLYELWLEQKFGSKLSIRAGQLAADSEFQISTNGANFVNGAFGWPAIVSSDLPSGGPAYPFATPGIRAKFDPTDRISFLIGLFDGDPAGPGTDDPQRRNRNGTNFRLNDDPFLIGEAQYKYNQDKNSAGLAGTVKFGAWNHFGDFHDLRFDTVGLSLANPSSTGIAAKLGGNYGFYGIVDQQIYRLPGASSDKGINVFARLAGSPEDRNLIDFYTDGGFVFNGFVPGRPGDSFGFGFAYASISDSARGLDEDTNLFAASPLPVRNYEAAAEVYYKAEIVPGFVIQPDFQYIWRPGGNVAGANGAPLGDAAIGGVRVSINY